MTLWQRIRELVPVLESPRDMTKYRFQYCPHCGEWMGHIYGPVLTETDGTVHRLYNFETMGGECPNCHRSSVVEHINA